MSLLEKIDKIIALQKNREQDNKDLELQEKTQLDSINNKYQATKIEVLEIELKLKQSKNKLLKLEEEKKQCVDITFIDNENIMIQIDNLSQLKIIYNKQKLDIKSEINNAQNKFKKEQEINITLLETNIVEENNTLRKLHVVLANFESKINQDNTDMEKTILNYQETLHTLNFNYTLDSESRFQNRNNNLENIIKYKELEKIYKKKNHHLQITLTNLQTELETFRSESKKNYTLKLINNNNKLEDLSNKSLNSSDLEKYIIENQQDLDTYKYNIKLQERKQLSEITMIQHKIQELKFIKNQKKFTLNKNPDYLVQIKNIKKKIAITKSKIHYNYLELENFKNLNYSEQEISSNQIIEYELLIQDLKKEEWSNYSLHTKYQDKILELDDITREINYYQNLNSKAKEENKIKLKSLHYDIENMKKSISKHEINILKNTQNLRFLEKKLHFLSLEYKKNNQKRLKRTNQQILQELDYFD